MSSKNNIAIIVAAGSSSRMNAEIPKQYIKISGKEILSYVIERFQNHSLITDVVLVINRDHQKYYVEIVKKYNLDYVITGGHTRQESVFKALQYCHKLNPDNVLIHDAARVGVTDGIITEAIKSLKSYNAAAPAIMVRDTVKRVKDNIISAVERENLYRIQTPQAFKYQIIYDCHKKLQNKNFSDDISIAADCDIEIKIFSGAEENFKITDNEDLERAKNMIEHSKGLFSNKAIIKTGFGYDIHRLSEKKENSDIMLGGVKIPHNQEIIAHSDGDVLIHAIVDAILGALALGDIGEYFPDTDPKYKNADSAIFLKKAAELLIENQAQIIHLDSLIICEKPKILPHKVKIKENLARLLKLNINQINVKATTHEKLDAIGEKRAIAAHSCVTIGHVVH